MFEGGCLRGECYRMYERVPVELVVGTVAR